MAPRKKPTTPKAKEPEQASTQDQPKADTGTQTGTGDTPAPAPDTSEDKAAAKELVSDKEPEDAGPETSASREPAFEIDTPEHSVRGATEGFAELVAQVAGLTERFDAVCEAVELLSKELEELSEQRGMAGVWDALDDTHDKMPDPLDETGLDEVGPDTLQVTVTGPEKGFWRIGRRFDATPTVIPAEDLTNRQYAALEADPALTVKIEAKADATAE